MLLKRYVLNSLQELRLSRSQLSPQLNPHPCVCVCEREGVYICVCVRHTICEVTCKWCALWHAIAANQWTFASAIIGIPVYHLTLRSSRMCEMLQIMTRILSCEYIASIYICKIHDFCFCRNSISH